MYTKIEIQGGRAGHQAVLSRPRGAEFIEVRILLPGGGGRTHHVDAADKDELWSMAQCLQQTLDGVRGCGGDVRSYFLPLELMSDL